MVVPPPKIYLRIASPESQVTLDAEAFVKAIKDFLGGTVKKDYTLYRSASFQVGLETKKPKKPKEPKEPKELKELKEPEEQALAS